MTSLLDWEAMLHPLRTGLAALALFSGLALRPRLRAEPAGPAPIRVATFFPVLNEIAAQIGGPEVTAIEIVRPGVDPHTFEPSPTDLRGLVGADLVLASDLGMESSLERLAANSGPRARVIDASAVLKGLGPYLEVNGRREPDPHWWNSIPATIRVVRKVASELSALRPGSAGAFAARADACVARLQALDQWARIEISSLPEGRRQLVTSHDAFAWFARDYGFTVHPVTGISPQSEPNGRDLAALIDRVRRDRIPAIFVENSVNPGLLETVTRETGARLGGALYADGLSADGDGTTYDGMFRHNVRTIVEALR